jgi:hypothetical protein
LLSKKSAESSVRLSSLGIHRTTVRNDKFCDRCVEPEEMKGRKLHELEIRNYHMRCLDSAGNHPEKDAKLLVGILVGVLLAVPVTMIVLVLLRKSRFGSRFFSRGPADYSRAFYSRADSGEN